MFFGAYLHNTRKGSCTVVEATSASVDVLPSGPMKTKSISESLRSLLAEKALILGPITLSSGSLSDHYFDCKRVTLSSEGADLVGDAVLDVLQRLPEMPEAIGGLTHGADPIIGAVMMRARERGIQLNGFYVRKEPKNHGTKNDIENAPPRGSRVVIVDDVVTLGGSVLKAVDFAEREGCIVVAVITLVDRLEGGGERISARVKEYIPLYTLKDFSSEIEGCQHHTTKSELLSQEVSQ
jgi:orotate phosphoribosyltransferase